MASHLAYRFSVVIGNAYSHFSSSDVGKQKSDTLRGQGERQKRVNDEETRYCAGGLWGAYPGGLCLLCPSSRSSCIPGSSGAWMRCGSITKSKGVSCGLRR